MFTTEREQQYNVTDILQPPQFELTSDELQQTQEGGNSILLGSTLRTATAYGRTATVKAGEDIRPALNSLKSAGGGTLILLAGVHRPTYDIVGDDSISIIGEGKDITIVDFGNAAYSLKYNGTTSDYVENFKIENLTIQNSSTDGISISLSQFWTIRSVKSYSHGGDGIAITRSADWSIYDSEFSANTGRGVEIISGANQDDARFTLNNVLCDSNGGYSYYLYANNSILFDFTLNNCKATTPFSDGFVFECLSGGDIVRFSAINCTCLSSSNSGFKFIGDSRTISGSLIACVSNSNTEDGFHITDIDYFDLKLVSCEAYQNGDSGIYLDSSSSFAYLKVIGGGYIDNGEYGIDINSGTEQLISACSIFDNTLGPINDNGTNTTIVDCGGLDITKEKKYHYMLNTSGGALAAGDTVIYKSVADGDEVTTTTTQGDDKVFGMATSAISNNALGAIQVLGKTTALKVNGTTDIAVGDFLATFTSAGIAAKATTGDMAFAIALEAYTTDDSNGVIDALLISPRKI